VNRENLVLAVADSQAAAWQLATVQAAAVGMLGVGPAVGAFFGLLLSGLAPGLLSAILRREMR